MTPDEANVKGQELANEIAPLLADLSIVGKHIAKALLQAVEEEREACAHLVDNFSWDIPMYKTNEMNNVTDDVAEMVREQAAHAIRARGKSND